MSLNIQECQRNAIVSMLSIQEPGQGSLLWKVLVFDKLCQNLLSPLMKVGSLRQHGVTLNLLLETERSAVPSVPAVYLVQPSEESILRVVNDMKRKLYNKFFINFSTSVSTQLLEKFAAAASEANCAHLVASVTDRFIHFVSLSPTEFSLDLNNAFRLLHGTMANDQEIEKLLSQIVDGILCVIVSLGTIPVIRCPSHEDSPATIVGRRLHVRGPASQLFGSALQERLCLILVDRELDISVMTAHSWNYQTLIHDIFGLRLNRVTIPSSNNNTTKNLDLDESDSLWVRCANKSFPEAAVTISAAFQEFSSKRDGLEGNSTEEIEAGLRNTIETLNAVPEMIIKKKAIDVHTTIATAIVTEISSRDLDRYYEVESGFDTGSVSAGLTLLEKMLSPSEKDTLLPAQLTKLKHLIKDCGGSVAALDFINRLESFKELQKAQALPLISAPIQPVTTITTSNTWILDKSKDLLQGVRSLLPYKKNMQICQTVLDLLELKGTHQKFLYLDPKAVANLGVSDEEAPRIKNPFRQAVVFCVGGGTYLESHALKELAIKHGKQILYGATDFATPTEFMNDLEMLGNSTK